MSRARNCFLRCITLAAGLGFGLQVAVGHAVLLNVTIDTTRLATLTTPPAPFALEFQFNDGDGTVNNQATLSNFNFGSGGAALGIPTYNCTSGSGVACNGIGGNLTSTVTFSDSSDVFNEFSQQFTPSASDPLRFQLDLTINFEPFSPDAFSLAIFDSSGIGIPSNFFDVFVQIDIASPLAIFTYASDTSKPPPGCATCTGIDIPAPTVSAATVPLPGTLVLLVIGLVGIGLVGKRARLT